ncbi:nucleophile aminohydrolase [Xylaria sp. FL0043]|nr:nucleophile aminohydrolase [Xylaria sp. FL0043]
MPLTTASIFPPSSKELFRFASRRSVVHSIEGIVACTQPLAARCGLDVLDKGGNCADAAVAVAAGLNMTEPCSTGIGGDMFCLFYSAKDRKISALNGSGRSGSKYTLKATRSWLGLKEGEQGQFPKSSVHSVTVPGAAAGWVDCVKRFGSGKLTLEQILAPAVKLGEQGFPVSEEVGSYWSTAGDLLRSASRNFAEMLKRDPTAPGGFRGPRPGEIMKNPTLAQTFRTLAVEGKKGFYTGRIAEAIIAVCKDLGGHLELEDLQHHIAAGDELSSPISLQFRGQGVTELLKDLDFGLELWEHPPNGQGLVALMALGILEQLEVTGKVPKFHPDDHNTTPYLHAIIESLRIAFADANWYVTDPTKVEVPTYGLISKEYLAQRAKLFDATKASDMLHKGHPSSPALRSTDTVYFAVSDSEGNAISFINSNDFGFGTGIIPRGCGFTLQCRGSGFSLNESHPNVIAPHKRPYHTIIPAAVTNLHDGSLHSVFGVMGGSMQPQGHVQVLLGQVVGGLNPQQALDAPRVCIGTDSLGTIYVEDGISDETVKGLQELGHRIEVVTGNKRSSFDSISFGRGQIIRWTMDPVENVGVWSAGSDPRGDGAAYPS